LTSSTGNKLCELSVECSEEIIMISSASLRNILLIFVAFATISRAQQQPNIIYILADDLGKYKTVSHAM
jgi:hypothetical protein